MINKSLFILTPVLIIITFMCGCLELNSPNEISAKTVAQEANQASIKAQALAQSVTPVPNISNFPTRNTVSKWHSHWDKPDAVSYVYLFIAGSNIPIGYFVSRGQPASTQSYLTPEYRERQICTTCSTTLMEQLPDIDGTYGSNNSGIRTFTTSGIALEAGGSALVYIFSDKPLPFPIPVPRLDDIKR
jgi:hypothetical protein